MHGCLSIVSVVCCQVEVSASGRSLVQGSTTECGVSECDREASIVRRPWPTGGCCARGERETPDVLRSTLRTLSYSRNDTKFLYVRCVCVCVCVRACV